MPHWQREAQEQELTDVEQRSTTESAVEAGALARWSRNLGQKERVRGLGLREESANGRANCQLTGDEQVAVLTSAWGKKR
jgi:hypothetical protein